MDLKKWADTYVVVMEVYTEKDLPELLRLLHCVRAKWESIATQLGLSQGDIEAIALKRSHDPDDCLKEVITLWLRGVDPVPTREQLARVLQSPPVGREDIAQQVVKKSPKKARHHSKFWLVCLCSILLVLVMIMGCAAYFYQDTSPGKSLSLPVLKQELIGREKEMKVIMGYFRNSDVKVVILHGQAGFGKSEIALHVGHRMLQLGLDVHYIKVEDFTNVSSLEEELMEISGKSYTGKRLVKWAKGLTKKTLLILDNVDGQHWVNDTSLQQVKELFLNPLQDNTLHLKVLITSQQDMRTKHAYRSYRLRSLSTKDCVHLMVNHSRHAESESDTADTDDLTVICDLVGNVPYASKILAKTLSSGTSAKYIIQELRLSEKSKNKIIAEEADKVDKDRLLSAIELAFQFVKKECQISTFLLIKFPFSFTLDDASRYISADMMSEYFNYTDFDLYKCLLELTAKSFLEIRQSSKYIITYININFKDDKYLKDYKYIISKDDKYLKDYMYMISKDDRYIISKDDTYIISKDDKYCKYLKVDKYHFHELSVDYLKITNSERIEILMAYWKKHLSSGFVKWFYSEDDNDYVALSQLINDDDFSFEASIALMIHFSVSKKSLISASRVLMSHCEVQDYNSTLWYTGDIVRGYTNLLEDVICQEEFPTEWNCMDVISLCLPIIDKFIDSDYAGHRISDFLVSKYLEKGSSHKTWDSIWKHSLRVYAYNLFPFGAFYRGLNDYSSHDEAIHSLHLALEDISSPYDFMTYMTLYTIYSIQDNLTGMEESLAGIHKLDFQQINITCYTSSTDYEDPHVTTAILFLQQVNETKLADKLRSKLFVATYAKMGCCDSEPHLLNSLYHDGFDDNDWWWWWYSM